MTKKLVPKIILEGTRLTQKTEIAFRLNEHPVIIGPRKYRYHSPLISAEWGSFSNYPWGRGPINFTPEQEAQAMAVYDTWAKMFELQRYYSWIIDRFHISTRVYQLQHHGTDYPFRWLENRLKPLGFVIVLCTRTPESFSAAREERLKVSGNPSQYDDIQPFIDEQTLFKRLVGDSILPSLTVDVSYNDLNITVDEIANWMAKNGHLYSV